MTGNMVKFLFYKEIKSEIEPRGLLRKEKIG